MSCIRLFIQIISLMFIPIVLQIVWGGEGFVGSGHQRITVGGVNTLVPSWSRGKDPRSGLLDLVSCVS